jgi:sigma-B regulation protein RsbU (phosphoserine phosphatase)
MQPDVLIIEDRDYLRQILVAVLQDYGYSTLGLGSAALALERLDEIQPRLVLLDMQMPGMDGREFLIRLRANPAWSELPVLVVSGFGETMLPSANRRALAVLEKPFDNTTLLAFVRQMIGPAGAVAAPA